MDILHVFDGYFLTMMILECFVLAFIDSKSFKNEGSYVLYKKSRITALILIILSVTLFLFRKFM